ncbi:MAG: stage II sporulation protein M, partial [Armatimonadetes bacterium]|nr:stage II sporulation protein M [Armatimonadota bacterium]
GLERLTLLYRSATADLARAQSEGWPRDVQYYLNSLVAKAHGRIYAVRPRKQISLLAYFFGVIPVTFRRRFKYVLASAAITIVAAAAAYAGARADPSLAHEMLGGFAEAVEEFATSEATAGHYFADQPFVKYLGGTSFSAFLFLHNLKVALQAFALGIAAGVLTVFVLIQNGVMLGAFLAIGANNGALGKLASVIAPHGALEIPAIIIAATGGLLMGHALINPGKWRRIDALRLATREALALLFCAAPLFVIAGIIEGNISPLFRGPFATDAVRFAFAAGVFALLCLYLWRGDTTLSPALRARLSEPPAWP